ncbi:MAG: UDP-N-acetylmuramate--L-alanine ligase, partial [Mycobacteriales bacterium]
MIDLSRVHLIGVGGAGMSGIARILLARGATVSGSDAKDSVTLATLRALGATVSVGHDPAQVPERSTVVVSSAIRDTNPELVEARRREMVVVQRAACLGALMVGRRGVAVTGTHGKTTTTSMLAGALLHCQADPSFAIGADLNEAGSNAHHGLGEVFVAEADESDESFLLLHPDTAVVTNIEADHLDHYGTPAAVAAAFLRFAGQIRQSGFLVCCADDAGAADLASAARSRGVDVRTYGCAEGADLRIGDLVCDGSGSRFQAVHRGVRLGQVELVVPGEHNARNGAGALLAGLGLGFGFADLAAGLAGFTGARRRFELKGTAGGVRVYDDYAHHPTELRATLAAARLVAGAGRVIVAFQPHLYSRTASFATEFGAALGQADEVVVLEVYGAREDPVPGVSGALVSAAVPLPAGRVSFQPSWSAAAADLAGRAAPGGRVVT